MGFRIYGNSNPRMENNIGVVRTCDASVGRVSRAAIDVICEEISAVFAALGGYSSSMFSPGYTTVVREATALAVVPFVFFILFRWVIS